MHTVSSPIPYAWPPLPIGASALGLAGDGLPLAPRGQPGLVVAGGDPQRGGAEEDSQRRGLRVDDRQDGGRRRLRVTGLGDPGLALLGGLLAVLVVGRVRRRLLGRGAAPVGGKTARLDDRDPDAEVGDLLGQRLADALQRPFRAVVDAAVRERAQPP